MFASFWATQACTIPAKSEAYTYLLSTQTKLMICGVWALAPARKRVSRTRIRILDTSV